jgi:hypothetical protein
MDFSTALFQVSEGAKNSFAVRSAQGKLVANINLFIF